MERKSMVKQEEEEELNEKVRQRRGTEIFAEGLM